MKTIRCFAAFAVLFAGLTAGAQSLILYGSPYAILSGVTVAGGATSNYTTAKIDATLQESVALEIVQTSAGTNVNNYTVTIQKSLDGENFDTTVPHLSWVIAATGATPQRIMTNFSTGGYGWFRVASIANANPATVISNITIRTVVKR